MVRTLRVLVITMGVACVAIGVVHLVFGIASVPGEGSASATVDSRERFYGAIFIGYGVAWWWAGRQRPIPAPAVRVLAVVFLLGGVGRVVSLVQYGRPQWFQLVLTGVELALPVLVLWLASADQRAQLAR